MSGQNEGKAFDDSVKVFHDIICKPNRENNRVRSDVDLIAMVAS